MNIFKLVLSAFITSIMCVDVTAGNAIYKWTDKDGGVHYGQTAPRGQQVEIITTKTPRSYESTEEDSKEDEDNINDAVTDETENTDIDAEDDEKSDATVPVATKDQATCDQALKSIQDLQRPVVTSNGKVMTIEEKNVELRNMDEIVKIHCP